MRALIIGLGSIGMRRARILKKLGVELVLCEHDADRADAAEKEFGEFVYSIVFNAINDNRCDVALICTPPFNHLPIAQHLALKGLNLFIEKPLCWDFNQCRSEITTLYQIMQENGCIGIIGQSYRFNPKLRDFAKTVDHMNLINGFITSGQHIALWHPGEDYHKTIYATKPNGGIVLTSLAHSLDQVQWLFGKIDCVSALIANSHSLGIEVDDTATLLLRMNSGAQVTIQNDFLRAPGITVIGATCAKPTGEISCGYWYPEAADIEQMYVKEMIHLISCVENHRQGQPDLLQGVQNAEWMDAAQRSSDTGTWKTIDGYWAELAGRQ